MRLTVGAITVLAVIMLAIDIFAFAVTRNPWFAALTVWGAINVVWGIKLWKRVPR